MEEFVKKNILGIAVSDASEQEILEYIAENIEKKTDPYYIVTPNPEIVVYAHKHPAYKAILAQARIALCDGVGLQIAGRLLGVKVRQRMTGTDLVDKLCKQVSEKPITVGFLGARPGVAEATAECLVARYPGLKVVYASAEWGENDNINEERLKIKDERLKNNEKIINHKSVISNQPIDILFVAFGFPKQEVWMSEHVGQIPVRVMVGVGGAFDYISGQVPRAPGLLRNIGLEWLFRLIVQPWRIVRQLALIEFVFLVLEEKLVKPAQ